MSEALSIIYCAGAVLSYILQDVERATPLSIQTHSGNIIFALLWPVFVILLVCKISVFFLMERE